MGIWNIYFTIEQFSSKLLNFVLSLEEPTTTFFDAFWGRIADWGFILIASIISAIVAVKLDRLFREKKRVHTNKLWKTAFVESFAATFGVFFLGLLIGAGLFIGIGLIKWGMNLSATATLVILITLIIIWRRKRLKKKAEIANKLQSGKKKNGKKEEEKDKENK